MTTQEAIGVLDEFRRALMTLDPTKGRQAFDALINDTAVMTTAMHRAAEAGHALLTLRRAFQETEDKGVQFAMN
jgi:hypothetical protein